MRLMQITAMGSGPRSRVPLGVAALILILIIGGTLILGILLILILRVILSTLPMMVMISRGSWVWAAETAHRKADGSLRLMAAYDVALVIGDRAASSLLTQFGRSLRPKNCRQGSYPAQRFALRRADERVEIPGGGGGGGGRREPRFMAEIRQNVP